ncbi:MAG: GspE/PulE family protein [Caldimicrobium sp.]|nr:GspE/PulE family protein [Caldimicrobium sp.]MCX7874423.1 GspE/PulE family protein [Caldimicrobium sp.]MDW8093992.1 GspE/PulE family protein [Caldimicrobium sp.]
MEKIKTFINFVKNNPQALEEISLYLEALSKEFSTSTLSHHLMVLAQDKNLPLSTKRYLLEFIGEKAYRELYIQEAIDIYSFLLKNFPSQSYLEKVENLKFLKGLERFKSITDKHNLKIDDLQEIYICSIEKETSIEALLIEKKNIPKEEILKALEKYYGVPALDLKFLINKRKLKRNPKVLQIKRNFFEENLCIAFELEGKNYLVSYNPKDEERIEKVKRVLQIPELKLAFALKEDILFAIQKYYDITFEMVEPYYEEVEEAIDETELVDSTIVNLVNLIIEEAYRRRASDIHWESLTGKRGLLVRFRVDGECFEYTTIPEHQKRGCISRIKIMANLDIAERRLPQDGKIKYRTKEGKTFELRVATIPTIENNEDVVMRILGGIEFRALEELDLHPEHYETMKKLLELPYGLILCVGPTGSGKTTTLHACLRYLNKPNKKIWTAEDPVEIVQDGLRQVQVNPKIGLTFSRVLRSFLRADPDIIMIGETRDQETAHTLIEASLTGHLVFSTLHTNSAPETVTRLLSMGIDPFNFADSLLGIIAQRLAKRLCSKCKQPYKPEPEELSRLKIEYGENPLKPLTDELISKGNFYRPVGCEHCNYTGFRGRIAIHEILVPDEELKELIIRNAPAQEIRKVALKKGFLTLKQDGILKVLRGETTLKQILDVTVR